MQWHCANQDSFIIAIIIIITNTIILAKYSNFNFE